MPYPLWFTSASEPIRVHPCTELQILLARSTYVLLTAAIVWHVDIRCDQLAMQRISPITIVSATHSQRWYQAAGSISWFSCCHFVGTYLLSLVTTVTTIPAYHKPSYPDGTSPGFPQRSRGPMKVGWHGLIVLLLTYFMLPIIRPVSWALPPWQRLISFRWYCCRSVIKRAQSPGKKQTKTAKSHSFHFNRYGPTIGNSLKKQKSLYKVLTPSIKPPYKFLWAYGSSWHIYASLVGKGLRLCNLVGNHDTCLNLGTP